MPSARTYSLTCTTGCSPVQTRYAPRARNHQQSSHHSSSHTASELVRLASSCLGLAFTECDSYYRGICHRADSPDSEIEIQPNPILGDDGEDDLYATEHPTVQVLLLTTTPAPNPALRAQLAAIEGLAHLQHESW